MVIHFKIVWLSGLWVVLCFFILGIGCKPPKPKMDSYYEQPNIETLDSTCIYFKTANNIFEPQYLEKYAQTTSYLENKQLLDSVARIHEIVGSAFESIYRFDSVYVLKSKKFLHKYNALIKPRFASGIMLNIGKAYFYAYNNDSAIKYLKLSAGLLADNYSYTNAADAEKYLANIYAGIGKLDLALQYGNAAFEKETNRKDYKSQFAVLHEIYNIYSMMGDETNGKVILQKSQKIAEKNKDTLKLYLNKRDYLHYYSVTGYSNSTGKNLPLIAQFDSIYQLYKTWKPQDLFIQFEINIFQVDKYLQENNTVLAKQHLDSCHSIMSRMKSFKTSVKEDYIFYKTWVDMKLNPSMPMTDDCINTIERLKQDQQYYAAKEFYEMFYNSALANKQTEKALDFKLKAIAMNDSLTNLQLQKQVKEWEKKYETKKKDNEILSHQQKIKTKNNNILLLTIGLFLLAILFILFAVIQKNKIIKNNRKHESIYTKQLLENTEMERKRIANDLHDGVGHELLNLKKSVEKSDSKIDEILNEIRRISRNLHPVMFDQIGLKLSVEQLVENFQTNENLFVNLNINYRNGLNQSAELQVYRIIQEALSNIKKYAQAYAANISINESKHEFELVIEDNGKGFDVETTLKSGNAFGLFGIMQRSKNIGGKADIESNNNGTKITIKTPLSHG